MRADFSTEKLEEELRDLDRKIHQLKLDYERYFLGNRPREPLMQRAELDKLMIIFANMPVQNTSLRFKKQSLCARYHALKRQWTETLRQIEQGTYARHRFKAKLHESERAEGGPPRSGHPRGPAGDEPTLYEQYRDARLACGQEVRSLDPAKLEKHLARQRKSLRRRYGDAGFKFRVVVEDGKAKLKATKKNATS